MHFFALSHGTKDKPDCIKTLDTFEFQIMVFGNIFAIKNHHGKFSALWKRLRICSVISVNYHYITVLCPFSLLIRFKWYNTV